ncbi:MAG: type II toxin-antitoxin system HicB family antitoxin [Candidatus Desantisbacteria bacterium]
MNKVREYEIDIFPDPEDPAWFCARVPDIPTIFTGGHSSEDALKNAKEAIGGYLEVCAEDNLPVPEPTRFYTEELAVRFPKDLHRVIIKEAQQKKESINELVVSLLNNTLVKIQSNKTKAKEYLKELDQQELSRGFKK